MMASSPFAGKSLVHLDCTQHNPLVDLSRKVIGGGAEDDFDETWNQFLESGVEHQNLHDEYLTNLTMSTNAPITTNLSELAEQIEDNHFQEIAEMWADEYTAMHEHNLTDHWVEEYSRLCLDEGQMKTENKTKDVSEMWATEFLDEFDRTSGPAQVYANSSGKNEAKTEKSVEERKKSNFSETYVFECNNPHIFENDAFQKGQQALSDGCLADAVLYFEAVVQQDEDNCDAWYLLGKCQTENENDRQAIAAYTTALSMEPHRKEVQLALVTAYINEDMEWEALEVLEQWIMSYSKTDSIPFKQSSLCKDQFEDFIAQTTKIEHMIREVLDTAETTDAAVFHNALSLVYNIKGDYERAAEEVKYAVMSNPEDYVLWNRLGATLANGKRAGEAVAAYRKALEICPTFTRARYNLGIACIQLKNYKEAIEHFITALQLQQYCGTISSSAIWKPLRVAVIRSCSPYTLEFSTAVNNHDLEKCFELIAEMNRGEPNN